MGPSAICCAPSFPGRARPRPSATATYFTDGVEDLQDGTTLFLAALGVVDGELRLEGKDDPAFEPLIA